MTKFQWIITPIVSLFLLTTSRAQSAHASYSADTIARASVSSSSLRELDSSLETVVRKVAPAVVQISANGYAPAKEHGQTDKTRVSRQHAIGSGVIVDPDGYIITNAHVIEGADRIRVTLAPSGDDPASELQPVRSNQILEAKVVGIHKRSDLALLKVEATNLPTIPVRSDLRARQGELVLAVGSPEGLRDSVTMGVVSSTSRQIDPDDPMTYIQTDAPINPGNSGGPLVDVDGNLVGINTFILSDGGGSEGLGFAIPVSIVDFDYQSLRKNGRVQRVAIGAKTQAITPTLAAGLELPRSSGVIISDIHSGGPAEAAGLRIDDIVLAVDSRPILGPPDFIEALYLHSLKQVMRLDVLRGKTQLSFEIPVLPYHDKVEELADTPAPQRTLVQRLGVFVTDSAEVSTASQDSSNSGIVITAEAAEPSSARVGLEVGDIIRAVDRMPLHSIPQLQTVIQNFRSGDPVVLQIEREGKLQYVAFELD